MNPASNVIDAPGPSASTPSGGGAAPQAGALRDLGVLLPVEYRGAPISRQMTLTEMAERAERVRVALGEVFPDTDRYYGGFSYTLTPAVSTHLANNWPTIVAAYGAEGLRARLEQSSTVQTEVVFTPEGGAAPRFSQYTSHVDVLVVGGSV